MSHDPPWPTPTLKLDHHPSWSCTYPRHSLITLRAIRNSLLSLTQTTIYRLEFDCKFIKIKLIETNKTKKAKMPETPTRITFAQIKVSSSYHFYSYFCDVQRKLLLHFIITLLLYYALVFYLLCSGVLVLSSCIILSVPYLIISSLVFSFHVFS